MSSHIQRLSRDQTSLAQALQASQVTILLTTPLMKASLVHQVWQMKDEGLVVMFRALSRLECHAESMYEA